MELKVSLWIINDSDETYYNINDEKIERVHNLSL
jgi:hypothetical protein